MDINRSRKVGSKTSAFKKIPIRNWDFKRKNNLAPDPQHPETISVVSLYVRQDAQAYEPYDGERPKGKAAAYESTPTGNVDNVTNDVADESDGITLGEFVKKRKCVEVTPGSSSTLTKKKKRLQARKTSLNEVKRPNPGPEGSQTVTKKGKSPAYTPDYFGIEKLSDALCSVELETALAKSKSPGIPITDAYGWRGRLLPTTSGVLGMEDSGMDRPILKCPLNRNPSEFTIPNDANRFMETL